MNSSKEIIMSSLNRYWRAETALPLSPQKLEKLIHTLGTVDQIAREKGLGTRDAFSDFLGLPVAGASHISRLVDTLNISGTLAAVITEWWPTLNRITGHAGPQYRRFCMDWLRSCQRSSLNPVSDMKSFRWAIEDTRIRTRSSLWRVGSLLLSEGYILDYTKIALIEEPGLVQSEEIPMALKGRRYINAFDLMDRMAKDHGIVVETNKVFDFVRV